MFTGIVEEIGEIVSVNKGADSAILVIKADKIFSDMHLGDSIAVNGICLTVTHFSKNTFHADVMHETLNRSSLKNLKIGSKVNLERAMSLSGRFGGHIVSGHVDTTGVIKTIQKDDNAIWFTIRPDSNVLRYIVEKGSITIDGISLTVAKVSAKDFAISAIPHTVKMTILKDKKPGDLVNLEVDIIGKYVEKLMSYEKPIIKSNLTMEFLSENGF